MKKTVLLVVVILVVLTIIGIFQYQNEQRRIQEILKYNLLYEEYNKKGLNGLDVTTIINKAINNNEKNSVVKDKDDFYIDNKNDSVIIEVKMIIDGKIYRMEQINQLGIEAFTEYFAEVKFDCTKVEYHEETGKISYMLFEATTY